MFGKDNTGVFYSCLVHKFHVFIKLGKYNGQNLSESYINFCVIFKINTHVFVVNICWRERCLRQMFLQEMNQMFYAQCILP